MVSKYIEELPDIRKDSKGVEYMDLRKESEEKSVKASLQRKEYETKKTF